MIADLRLRFGLILGLLFFSIQQPVLALGEWYELRDSVVMIKPGVKKIPDYAFRDRIDISTVRFEYPCAVTSVGDYAFLGCENLRSIELPRGLRSLGEGSFRECGALERIDIPDGVAKLPKFLFYWCENLRSVKLPKQLTVIERGCFGYCGSLESIAFPVGLKNIGSNAFSCCESLTEVRIPSSVVELESYAFSDCRSLRRITFPRNSALLGELILSGCDNVEEICELSGVPPKFDCNSFIFEPDETEKYKKVILKVAPGRGAVYKKAPGWELFKNIED